MTVRVEDECPLSAGICSIMIHVIGSSIEARGIETFRDRLCRYWK